MHKKKASLKEIYRELTELHSLEKVKQEALWNCYDENRDYGHVFAIDTIYNDKFTKILSDFKSYIFT